MPPSVSPWSPTRFAEHGAVRLAFDAFTEGASGTPLLVATGLGVNRRWLPDGLCQTLAAAGFAVARYDQRDGGESTHLSPAGVDNPITALFRRRGSPYTAAEMADDAVAVLDALGWRSAHLLGVSLGGAVVQRVALRHPHRVRSLTSLAAVPGDVAGLRALRYVRLRTLARFARLRFPETPEGRCDAQVAVARLLASPSHPFDEAAARAAAERNPDAGAGDPQAQSRQIGAQWHGPGIDSVARPTLVLHGSEDPLIRPSAGVRIAARIPGARLVPLPGIGHELPERAWPRLVTELSALTQEADRATGTAAS